MTEIDNFVQMNRNLNSIFLNQISFLMSEPIKNDFNKMYDKQEKEISYLLEGHKENIEFL
jgi:hypothetical protein